MSGIDGVFDAIMHLDNDPSFRAKVIIGFSAIFFVVIVFTAYWTYEASTEIKEESSLLAYLRFIWGCFLKPHTGDKTGSQQDALESFYKVQADIYDATRSMLLKGREDMLGLVAAQVQHKVRHGQLSDRPIWVDIGGGTGWNIEQMGRHVSVPDFFHAVYLVDLSPSLLDVARRRFERLGWNNVHVICQDARTFRLHEYEKGALKRKLIANEKHGNSDLDEKADAGGAELVTMSYALSMIPEFHPVIDSVSSLLAPNGVIAVCDFYVQNAREYQSRNYTGGGINRHCIWISRVFWRTWFDFDRVNLDAARRDYLEYRFGTVLSVNARNHMLGFRIPYYLWVGCSRQSNATAEKLAELDSAATESPFMAALDLQTRRTHAANASTRSKSFERALINLSASLPLPASFYQNHHWRIYFDDQLQKHHQFNDSYIYAFTWEDSKIDARLLKVQSSDVILALTSAGDNILSFALERPRRIHAVDLNPAQNHLLELKAAAYTALGYSDFWKLFGEGKHTSFRDILITKLSPHMSSLAFQFWLSNGPEAFNTSKGLYHTGGSGHALKLVGRLFRLLGLEGEVKALCNAPTLNEQREIWNRSLKRVLLSRLLSWTIISNEKWLWKALGVPAAQRNLIEHDYLRQDDIGNSSCSSNNPNAPPSSSSSPQSAKSTSNHFKSGHAIWEYVTNTFEPVVSTTLLSSQNHYYLLCLLGHYTPLNHPCYLTPKAHTKLSRPDAFDRLRIHTDELSEVIERMSPGTLTIAVVMDSMDWFDPEGMEADKQVRRLNRALKVKGRVLLRSAGLKPWYVDVFERLGFEGRRVGCRIPGSCVDRVNMYASTWVMTKTGDLEDDDTSHKSPPAFQTMAELDIGRPSKE